MNTNTVPLSRKDFTGEIRNKFFQGLYHNIRINTKKEVHSILDNNYLALKQAHQKGGMDGLKSKLKGIGVPEAIDAINIKVVKG